MTMIRKLSLLFLLLLSSSIGTLCHRSPPPLIDRYTLRRAPGAAEPQEYIDPTDPPVLPDAPLLCTVQLLQHDFANTYGAPPASANYTPPGAPNCSCWTHAVLELSGSVAGDQYDRIAAVWLDGAELLRTSTPEPTESGVIWKVRKDITRYSALLRQPEAANQTRVVSVMLENIVNDVYTGVFHINVSIHLYGGKNSPDGSLPPPADLVIPISEKTGDTGFWFRIQSGSDSHGKSVQIPTNTYRAVLEVFVSSHSDDEFWYSNPPTSYIKWNHLPTNRGNRAFRQIVVSIDGMPAGYITPFPVVFTGGINPLFWEPVVSIGDFNLPSYELELTPFLGKLLDGKNHSFAIGVKHGIPFWLVDANLHLWLDIKSNTVEAELTQYISPEESFSWKSKSAHLDGKFELEYEREVYFAGWVKSSSGNHTTHVEQSSRFKSEIQYKNNSTEKKIITSSKSKSSTTVEKDGYVVSSVHHKSKFPIEIHTSQTPGLNNAYTLNTKISHGLYVETQSLRNGLQYQKTVSNEQKGYGWMEVRDHSVLSGSVTTQQSYSTTDGNGCYSRSVTAQDGKILQDGMSTTCVFAM